MEFYAIDGYKDLYECPSCGYRERTGNRLGLGILGTATLALSLGMGLFAFLGSAFKELNKNTKQPKTVKSPPPQGLTLPGFRYIFCQCCEQQIPSYSNFCPFCGIKRANSVK
jgi:RNA polymerase subunit RPABC4/transcription elongation factor Spt4